jgi:hypothetical protein
MAHAKLSPSGADRWMVCPGSVVLEAGKPDSSSHFADEGTAAHFLAATCLEKGNNARDYAAGMYVIQLCENEFNGSHFERFKSDGECAGKVLSEFTVDYDMAEFVQAYVDRCRAVGGEQFYEQRLYIGDITGEEDAHGTSDFVGIADGELVIRDLKYGRGVKVDADGNRQLRIYALAAMDEFGLLYDFDRVRVCIDQPRIGNVSEAVYTIEEMEAFREEVGVATAMVEMAQKFCWVNDSKNTSGPAIDYDKLIVYLKVDDKACTFCKAKAECPRMRNHVLTLVADDFVDESKPIAPQLEHAATRTMDNALLGNLLSSVDIIEDFCKAIRAKAEAELFAGRDVPGFKLVEGRKGSRKWSDANEVEQVMKSMRLKLEEMYDFSLISPTTAEKLNKAGTIGPRQWPKLKDMITQSEGKPSVAPASDKRPALKIAAVEDEFADESADTIDDLI